MKSASSRSSGGSRTSRPVNMAGTVERCRRRRRRGRRGTGRHPGMDAGDLWRGHVATSGQPDRSNSSAERHAAGARPATAASRPTSTGRRAVTVSNRLSLGRRDAGYVGGRTCARFSRLCHGPILRSSSGSFGCHGLRPAGQHGSRSCSDWLTPRRSQVDHSVFVVAARLGGLASRYGHTRMAVAGQVASLLSDRSGRAETTTSAISRSPGIRPYRSTPSVGRISYSIR